MYWVPTVFCMAAALAATLCTVVPRWAARRRGAARCRCGHAAGEHLQTEFVDVCAVLGCDCRGFRGGHAAS